MLPLLLLALSAASFAQDRDRPNKWIVGEPLLVVGLQDNLNLRFKTPHPGEVVLIDPNGQRAVLSAPSFKFKGCRTPLNSDAFGTRPFLRLLVRTLNGCIDDPKYRDVSSTSVFVTPGRYKLLLGKEPDADQVSIDFQPKGSSRQRR